MTKTRHQYYSIIRDKLVSEQLITTKSAAIALSNMTHPKAHKVPSRFLGQKVKKKVYDESLMI